jgi:AmiR/NasT family two-component response regulator
MSETGRILLVGDAQSLQETFAACMPVGDIAAAPDAVGGLEYLRNNSGSPPRLIVLEAEPGAVVEAVGAFKRDAQAQVVPLLVLCKGNDPDLFGACYRAGANACVVKPAAMTDLRALVTTAVEYWLGVNEVPPPA